MLCIRFPNWPIQSLQQRLRTEGDCPPSLALHTTAPGEAIAKTRTASEIDLDLKYLRSVFPSASGGPAVVAVSRDAWQAGVRPGMPLAEARSMAQPLTVHRRTTQCGTTQCGTTQSGTTAGQPRRGRGESFSSSSTSSKDRLSTTVVFHEWNPASDRRTMMTVAEMTRRYAPVVGLDSMPMPDSLLLDITGCGQLFGGEAALAELLVWDLRQSGWHARVAIADTIAAVWALTHTEQNRPETRRASSSSRGRATPRAAEHSMLHDLPIQIIPPGQHRQELANLPIAASRLPLKDLQILAHLGIRSIGQLLALPREDLPSRLSENAVVRVQQLLSITDEFILPLPESNPVVAAWSSEYPARNLDDIRKVLQHLIENVAEQIVRRGIACSLVSCELTCVSGAKLSLSAGVVKPTQAAELLLDVLSLRLEILSLTEPVAAIFMTLQTVSIPALRQRDLFSPTEHIRPQEELATLIARLSNRLGPQSVSTLRSQADPRPEHAVALDSVIPGDGSGFTSPQSEHVLQRLTEPDPDAQAEKTPAVSRPLRLLAAPLQVVGHTSKDKLPESIPVLGKVRRVIGFMGPERIQTAWWTDQPCNRDYFRVITDSGSQLWVFRDLQNGNWYLHGLFD